jgi:hypothetical protein
LKHHALNTLLLLTSMALIGIAAARILRSLIGWLPLDAIDNWRFKVRKPSRAVAVREIVRRDPVEAANNFRSREAESNF